LATVPLVTVADQAAQAARVRPEALASDFARRASSARAVAVAFALMTLLATCSTLAMSGRVWMALPSLLAAGGFGAAFWVAKTPERASFAGAILISVMLLQYAASSYAARQAEHVIAIAYFVALCPLVAKATMRARGVLLCGAPGVLTLLTMGWLRDQAATGHWRELVGPSYYFAATWLVAVVAAIGAERALRSHIREELRAAHALAGAREAEGRYQLVSEQVSDLVSVLDDQGRFVYVSPSHERVLGLPVAEVLGQAAPELVHPDDYESLARAFLKALQADSTFTVARLRAKDASYRWFHIRFSRIDPESQVAGTVAVSARDITEQQRLSEALEGTRRMESLGRLAGGVAHDFNNMLLVIQACADLASRQLPPEHAARSDLTDILRTTERAAALTKQLLTFARRQVLGTRQRATVSSVLAELLPILERLCGNGIRVSLQAGPGAFDVNASAVEIEQILMNLAANARDAMPEGGTLSIRTQLRSLAEGELDGQREGDYVELCLRDSGVGMSPQVQARIFEPFYTTKPAGRGTGLGLATVFGLVAQLGGHVAVASVEGEGTEFRVLLPCAVVETSSAVMRAAKLPPKSLEVLVVDDEDAVRTLIGRILDAAGHRVTQAASAEMAIAAAKAASTRFDVILTDVVLGTEDGLAMLDTLRAAHPSAAVIVMSGYSPTPERVAELSRQGAELLPKPFGAVQLMAALERARVGGS
jgi:two-component system, cell cycle sensor histidine kinase and response regulator CckA